jgi:lysophospholipase L1-like esterase
LCIGDSLTNSIPSNAPVGDYPHKWVEGVCAALNIPDFSLGGGAGANVANVGDNTIYSRVMSLSKDEEVDIITFWGGTNDWGASVEIGDIKQQTNPSTRDNTTFMGGLCACVEKLLSLYPTKRIILIGTTPRTSNNNQDTYHNTTNSKGKYLKDYVDAVKEVAEWYGLPFLDLLRTSGMNVYNMEQYFYPQNANDGSKYYLHFSQQGEDLLAEKIAAFIRTIIVA